MIEIWSIIPTSLSYTVAIASVILFDQPVSKSHAGNFILQHIYTVITIKRKWYIYIHLYSYNNLTHLVKYLMQYNNPTGMSWIMTQAMEL